ncbi:SusD/RagB family nutrient-binding outer membrane lipoprotein [Nitritalea halalkaliphila]|uniref:SusD/RagB family nutrient-binding outer membrane lipoprotein n=1 Tax=Nitritalea halalkaliphila TaxID=590849 RepID=UPI0002D8BD34|nr:SusD/RagB family nutrient-binding outer membrane lipoprotein [Nitritalea halalkaliphila]
MKRKLYSIFLALSVLFVSSCELDLLDDPNAVTGDTANPSFVLNRIQTDYAALFNTASTFGMRLTRIMSQPNNLYEQAYVPVTFNGIWTNSYANILNDIQFLEELNETTPIPQHLGIARTIKALVLMHLVDHFDEVPFSEALNPAIFNPLVDPGEQVYAASLTAIQEARDAFAQSSPFVPTDFFYGNSREKWLKLLNTLEVRYHLNRKLVDPNGARSEINRLIATGELLAEGDDFVFRYGTSQTNPDSRHPRYSQYGQGGGDYQSTWYMFHLTEAKGFNDPRARFYIYRQVNENPTDPDKLRCISEIAPSHYLAGGWPFCLPNMIDGRGYWGRDHLNAEGIPPDNFEQSVYGLYPAGGRFDDDSASPVDSPTLGNGGAGIQPIMLSSFLDFMLAEAAQTIGTTGILKCF